MTGENGGEKSDDKQQELGETRSFYLIMTLCKEKSST